MCDYVGKTVVQASPSSHEGSQREQGVGSLLSIPSLAHTLYKAYEKIHGSITGGVCAPVFSVAQLMKSGVSAGKARGSTPSRSPIRRCMPS